MWQSAEPAATAEKPRAWCSLRGMQPRERSVWIFGAAIKANRALQVLDLRDDSLTLDVPGLVLGEQTKRGGARMIQLVEGTDIKTIHCMAAIMNMRAIFKCFKPLQVPSQRTRMQYTEPYK